MRKFKSVSWLLALLLAWLVAFAATGEALALGVEWAIALLAIVWGASLLALSRRWIALRDIAWVAGVGYAVGLMRWLDGVFPAPSGLQRVLLLGTDLLCLVLFTVLVPGTLAWIAQRLWNRSIAVRLPVEKPADPARRR